MSDTKIPAAPVIPAAPGVKQSAVKAPAKPAPIKPAVVQPAEPEDAPEQSKAIVEQPEPPTLVQLRAAFEFAQPFQRVSFHKGQVLSSQHYDIQKMRKQGAQLDVVVKDDESGEYEVIMDFNEA